MESILVPVSKWATWGEEGCSPQPQVGFIEPLVRRRLSFLDRIALHVANACVAEGEPVREGLFRLGTEAPDVTPTVVTPSSHARSISEAWSTR